MHSVTVLFMRWPLQWHTSYLQFNCVIRPRNLSLPRAAKASQEVIAAEQAGTYTVGIGRMFWSDDTGTSVESSDESVCGSGRKLLETASSGCLPNGKYDATCDLCCDPNSDARCTSASTAEEYATGQLATAQENAGSAAAVAAVSGVVSSVADYYLRTRTTTS
jgi:hypothetical protein